MLTDSSFCSEKKEELDASLLIRGGIHGRTLPWFSDCWITGNSPMTLPKIAAGLLSCSLNSNINFCLLHIICRKVVLLGGSFVYCVLNC
ncbi:hypothetical protein IC582_022978 [Cucumis melo]